MHEASSTIALWTLTAGLNLFLFVLEISLFKMSDIPSGNLKSWIWQKKRKKLTTTIVGACRKILKPGGLDNFAMYKSTACISLYSPLLQWLQVYALTLSTLKNFPPPKSGPYITFSIWGGVGVGVGFISCSREHGHPAAVHSRGVWGHAPPGNFRCSEVHYGTFWGIQRSIFIIACWATRILETISIG